MKKLQKVSKAGCSGPATIDELPAIKKRLAAVDAAMVLCPERLHLLSLQDMHGAVRLFEEDGHDLPLETCRMISNLVASEHLMKNQLAKAVACCRVWGSKDDPDTWTPEEPLMSAFPYDPASENAKSYTELALNGFLNPALLKLITSSDTTVPKQWCIMLLESWQASSRVLASLHKVEQQATEVMVSVARGLLSLLEPEPFPFGAKASDVDTIVPASRIAKRQLEPYLVSLKDTINQNAEWKTMLDNYRAFQDKEAAHGSLNQLWHNGGNNLSAFGVQFDGVWILLCVSFA